MSPAPFTIAAVRAALPGLTVVRYITSGGQKHVYECQSAQQHAALKLTVYTAGARERAVRELDAMNLVNCAHLVRPISTALTSVKVAGLRCFYFLEHFVDGVTLDQRLNQQWPEDAIRTLGLALIDAVEALWAHNLVHRDIKPNNIIATPSDDFVLLDVGVARHQTLSTLTQTGAVVGTYGFFSPEQLRGERKALDFRSDLHMIGANLYLAATTQHPFLYDGPPDAVYVDRVVKGIFPKVRTIRQGLNADLEAAIHRMLAPWPHRRYKSLQLAASRLT